MFFKVQYVNDTRSLNQIGYFKVWGVYVLGECISDRGVSVQGVIDWGYMSLG